MHHLEGYEQSEIIRARASSCLTAWVQSPEGELTSDGIDEENQRVFDMAPGQVKYLAPGESVHVPDLNAPDGQFEPFVRAMLRALSASIGISYSTLSRDSSQSNYSSSRLDLLQDQESFKALQAQLKDILLDKVYQEWLEVAVLGGSLQLPNYQSEPERYQMCRFMFKGMGWVDPMKEVQAANLAVKSGFKLQSQVLSELSGTDLEEFLIARRNEQDMAASYNLSFDTDSVNIATQAKVDETPDQSDDENGT
jgi:lambda family phage portal protein